MDSKLRKALEERRREYDTLVESADYYAAFIRAAEIDAVTALETSPTGITDYLSAADDLPSHVIEAVQHGAKRTEDRIRQIMSTGSHWNEDEIMLVLTLRIQNDVLYDFLTKRGVGIAVDSRRLRYESLIEKFEECCPGDLIPTLAAIRRNWGVPLKHTAFLA